METLRTALILIGVLLIIVIYLLNKGENGGALRWPRFRRAEKKPVRPLAPRLDVDELNDLGPIEVPHTPANLGPEHDASMYSEAESQGHDFNEELILAFTVMAPESKIFLGSDLHQALDEAGFRYGDMHIYHYYADGRANARPLCSVANVLEPGIFEPEALETLTTPGLSLFARLPGPLDERETFEKVLQLGRRLAESLHAELCDETRSRLSAQHTSLIKDKVEAFRFKRKLANLQHHRSH